MELCKRGEAVVRDGSPFDLKGYKSDTLFKVTSLDTQFNNKLVWLQEDDGSNYPEFTDGVSGRYFGLGSDEIIEYWEVSTTSKSSSNHDEQPAKLPTEVTRTSTYTVKIKGHEFTLTEDEYYDLRSKLEDVE